MTPVDRLSVATVTATVTVMTAVSLLGIRSSAFGRMEYQSEVEINTMITTATIRP